MRDNDAPLLMDVSRLVWRQWAGVRPTGIDRICMAWMAHFGTRAQATVLHRHGRHILRAGASRELFALLADETPAPVIATRLRLARWVARHGLSGLASPAGGGRPWLNIGHTGLDLPGLETWCSAADVKPVLMVHDLIPLTHPEFCRAGEPERHRQRMRTLLRISKAIIGNSQHTIDVLGAFAEAEQLPQAPTLVAWPGTQRLPLPAQRPENAYTDFVILGTIEGRKNHLLLLDIWQQLIRRLGTAAPRLVIIGRRGWACDDVLARLDSGEGGDHVVETGPLSDGAIAAHLAGARALLFPSFAEGYGLPLLEALAAGVPAIAADLPVFREIGQGIPLMLPPDDVEAWMAAISGYAQSDSASRAAQIARLKAFKAPDWAGHFARVDAFLGGIGPFSPETAPPPAPVRPG